MGPSTGASLPSASSRGGPPAAGLPTGATSVSVTGTGFDITVTNETGTPSARQVRPVEGLEMPNARPLAPRPNSSPRDLHRRIAIRSDDQDGVVHGEPLA